jgi:hypothetical protein
MFPVEELGQEIAVLAVHIDAATHRLLECIRHFDEAGGWYQQGAQSCAHWLAWRVGWDPATAREKVRVARALGKLPAIDQALKTGKLSYAKARALTRIAKPETEAELVAMSAYATGAQLERLCRGYPPFAAPCPYATEAAAFQAAPTRASCMATTCTTGFTAARPV